MTTGDTSETLQDYREAGLAWDLFGLDNISKANALLDRLHRLAKRLRETSDGRAGLEGLMRDEQIGVRLLAATECLTWAADLAVPVLEEIEGTAGSQAFSAKYTLKQFRAGTWKLDW